MNIIKSTGTFSFYTLISRITGYLRDILIAIFLGSGPIADAFLLHLEFQIRLEEFLEKAPSMQLLYQVTQKS